MELTISNLKNRIATFLLKFKYRRTSDNLYDYDSFYSDARYILLILPVTQEEILNVLTLIKNVILDKKRITILSRLEFKSRLTEFDMFNIIYYTDDAISKIGLPKKQFLKDIVENPYDIVIDLNIFPNLFALAVTMAVKSRFKVGFTREISEKMYNFQIKPDKNISANSFRFLLNSLKMF